MTEPTADLTQVISEKTPLLRNRVVSHTVHAGSIAPLLPVILLFSTQVHSLIASSPILIDLSGAFMNSIFHSISRMSGTLRALEG